MNRFGFTSDLGVPAGYTGPKCGKTAGVTFTAASLSCATSYQWTANNSGWKDANGATSPWTTTGNQLVLYPSGSTSDDGTITANINIGCGTLTQTYRAIYTNPPLPTPVFNTSSTNVLCRGTEGSVSINAVPEADTYAWYSADGLLINNIAATSSNPIITTGLSVNVVSPTNRTFGFLNLRVVARRANLNCAGSAESVHPIWVGKPDASINTLIYPMSLRGTNPVTLNPSAVYQFYCDAVNGFPTSWTWTLPNGFSFYTGGTTSSPRIQTSATDGTYMLYCRVNNICGSSYTMNLTINIGSGGGGIPLRTRGDETKYNPAEVASVEIQEYDMPYPNPSNETFNILVDEHSSLTISNTNAQNLLSIPATGKVSISVADFPDGVYVLTISKGNRLVKRKVIVQH